MAHQRQAEGGVPAAQLCHEREVSDAAFNKRRAKCGGMDVSLIGPLNAID